MPLLDICTTVYVEEGCWTGVGRWLKNFIPATLTATCIPQTMNEVRR